MRDRGGSSRAGGRRDGETGPRSGYIWGKPTAELGDGLSERLKEVRNPSWFLGVSDELWQAWPEPGSFYSFIQRVCAQRDLFPNPYLPSP